MFHCRKWKGHTFKGDLTEQGIIIRFPFQVLSGEAWRPKDGLRLMIQLLESLYTNLMRWLDHRKYQRQECNSELRRAQYRVKTQEWGCTGPLCGLKCQLSITSRNSNPLSCRCHKPNLAILTKRTTISSNVSSVPDTTRCQICNLQAPIDTWQIRKKKYCSTLLSNR